MQKLMVINSSTLVHWYISTLVHWYIGTLVHWYISTLVHWYIDTLVFPFYQVTEESDCKFSLLDGLEQGYFSDLSIRSLEGQQVN